MIYAGFSLVAKWCGGPVKTERTVRGSIPLNLRN
jgi:hypothetical protein